jgi:hypothetical protein
MTYVIPKKATAPRTAPDIVIAIEMAAASFVISMVVCENQKLIGTSEMLREWGLDKRDAGKTRFFCLILYGGNC